MSVFFSEYIEGSFNSRALELFNNTGSDIDLANEGYVVQIYANGSLTPTHTINLSGIFSNDDTFVVGQSGASFSILAQADQINSGWGRWFTGNDAIVLRKGGVNGEVLDSLGQIGNSDFWGKNTTLIRSKDSVQGDTNPFDSFSTSNYTSFASNSFGDAGYYYTAPVLDNSSPFQVVFNEDNVSNISYTVEQLILNRWSDVNSYEQIGIAVTQANSINGIWQYSIDGGNAWVNFNNPALSNATLLAPTAQIRFIGDAEFSGAIANTFEFRAWDGSEGINGQTDFDASIGGGRKSVSEEIAIADILIRNSNDAPDFDGGNNQALRFDNTAQQTIYGWADNFTPGAGESDLIQGYSIDFKVASQASFFEIAPYLDNSGSLIYKLADNIVSQGTSFYSLVQLEARVIDDGGTDNGGINTSEAKDFFIRINGSSSNFITIQGGIVYGSLETDSTSVVGTDANDRISGENNSLISETLQGGIGSDRVFGRDGDDTLYGESIVLPNYATNSLNNFTFDDNLAGGNGNDILYGQLGNDRLFGDAGDDVLYGGIGNDDLSGGSGNDILNGGSGNDILNGGNGADIFKVISSTSTTVVNATIEDFESGIDKLDLPMANGSTLSYTQIGNDLLIDYTSGSRTSLVTLKNHNLSTFSPSTDII